METLRSTSVPYELRSDAKNGGIYPPALLDNYQTLKFYEIRIGTGREESIFSNEIYVNYLTRDNCKRNGTMDSNKKALEYINTILFIKQLNKSDDTLRIVNALASGM
ncbi:hypothetical protein FQR65_LT01194 [Abscondita terminalis]|nr:hypothetical protein FQR65_LT01194 [Abscondita terminalis]